MARTKKKKKSSVREAHSVPFDAPVGAPIAPAPVSTATEAPSPRPQGAPKPEMVDAEYETATHHVFKIKQKFHAVVGSKKVAVPK